MTRTEATKTFAAAGILHADHMTLGPLHIAYCQWIDRRGKGGEWLPISEAYHALLRVEPAGPVPEQGALFVAHPSA